MLPPRFELKEPIDKTEICGLMGLGVLRAHYLPL